MPSPLATADIKGDQIIVHFTKIGKLHNHMLDDGTPMTMVDALPIGLIETLGILDLDYCIY